MRIYFVGSHATGKTTMTRWVSRRYGLPMILSPDQIIRRLRQWLLLQLRWVRRPGYRRMLKIYGWLLFVTGALLMLLLLLVRGP